MLHNNISLDSGGRKNLARKFMASELDRAGTRWLGCRWAIKTGDGSRSKRLKLEILSLNFRHVCQQGGCMSGQVCRR